VSHATTDFFRAREKRPNTQYHQRLLATVHVLPEAKDAALDIAYAILRNAWRYVAVERDTVVPFEVVALIHHLDFGGSLKANMTTGEPWGRRDVNGNGPWLSWHSAAVDAMLEFRDPHSVFLYSHNVPASWLAALERHNGEGYWARGLPSAYVYAGTNHGVGTGFYGADGRYTEERDAGLVGAAPVIMAINDLLTNTCLEEEEHCTRGPAMRLWHDAVDASPDHVPLHVHDVPEVGQPRPLTDGGGDGKS